MTTLLNPWNWCRSWSRRRSLAESLCLKSSAELRDTLERERMRADRSGSTLALLTFHFPEAEKRCRAVSELACFLQQRLRATDTAGYLDDERIAVVLPETGELGAHLLASQVEERLAAHRLAVDYELYLYPEPVQRRPEAAASDPLRASRADAAPRSVDDWFVQPIPFWKRSLDILGAVVGLAVSLPILLVAALAIKATSRGPVFFLQRRTGLGGKPFTIYKLRTMRTDAEAMKAALRAQSEQDGPAFKIRNDPRITPVGRFLRKACIDELPQLWNVLRGEMSLVGPRPLPCDEADKCLGWQQRRLHVTPGLTCFWQVFGGLRVPFQEWMRMDLRYVRGRRLRLDLALIARTFWAVIRHRASH